MEGKTDFVVQFLTLKEGSTELSLSQWKAPAASCSHDVGQETGAGGRYNLQIATL